MRTDPKGYIAEPNMSSRKLTIDEDVSNGIIDATRLLVQNFYELVDENQLGTVMNSVSLAKVQDSIDKVARLSSRLGRFTSDTRYWVSLRELSELVSLRIRERHGVFIDSSSDSDSAIHRFVGGLLADEVFIGEVDGILEELVKLTPLSLASCLSFCTGESTYAFDKEFSVQVIERGFDSISAMSGETILRKFIELASDPEGRLETFRGSVGESVAIVKVIAFPIVLDAVQIAALKVAYLVERRTGERAYRYSHWKA